VASAGYSGEITPRRSIRGLDYGLLLSTAFLMGIGLMSLYSEGIAKDGLANFRRQIISTLIGIIPFLIMLRVRPTFWRRVAPALYGTSILLLLATLVLGKDAKGAQRWIDIGPLQFQPSELVKLFLILTLASFYANRHDRINHLSTFLLGFVHVAIPMALILKQPSLTAAMVLLSIWFAISLLAGVPMKFFATSVAIVAVLATAVFTVPAASNYLLQDYQKERIDGLLRGKKDKQGDDWQSVRAEIAFGVGGVTGTGFLRGEQKEGKYIPEQRNDFVFTVIGEEGGLIGTTMVLVAFGVFFWRIFLVMVSASDDFERYIVGGVFTLLAMHTIVNIAMVLHVLPVAGLWLPFMSSGGTAIWLCMGCVGLLLNIRRRERPILF
jgi:rod shape determining protein RodA